VISLLLQREIAKENHIVLTNFKSTNPKTVKNNLIKTVAIIRACLYVIVVIPLSHIIRYYIYSVGFTTEMELNMNV